MRRLQIDWCNPVAEQHLGISLRADQGLRVTNLVRDPEFVGYMTSARFDQALVFQPMSRPGLALEVRVVEFELARLILITRDITQRERVDAVRRDFIANVSHELRTPLTVVNGFLETLIDAQSGKRRRAPASFAVDARAGAAHAPPGRGPADTCRGSNHVRRRCRTKSLTCGNWCAKSLMKRARFRWVGTRSMSI